MFVASRHRVGLLIGIPMVALALLTVAAVIVLSQVLSPDRRNIAAELHTPLWLEAVIEHQSVNFRLHVALGTVLNRVGASPTTAAREWTKAADRAVSNEDMDTAVQGFGAAAAGLSPEGLAGLCPIFSETSPYPDGGWPVARREQYALVAGANLECPGAVIWGQIPDDFPITYARRPPTTGVFHATWYPSYGVASEPVPVAMWLHNVAHGAVVFLYNCPSGCPDIVAQAVQMQADLPLGRNPRSGGAAFLITADENMDSPIAVVAWGKLLVLQQFDRDQIEDFFEANVDRGPECRDLACPD